MFGPEKPSGTQPRPATVAFGVSQVFSIRDEEFERRGGVFSEIGGRDADASGISPPPSQTGFPIELAHRMRVQAKSGMETRAGKLNGRVSACFTATFGDRPLRRKTNSRLPPPRESIRPRAALTRQEDHMARTADQHGRTDSPEGPHPSAVPTDKSLESPP